MIRGLPVWLNEILVTGIKIIVVVSLIFCVFYILYLLNAVYCIMKKRKESIGLIKKSFKVVTSIMLIFATILLLFYYPVEVLPLDYNFNSITVSISKPRESDKETITVKDEMRLEEFRKVLKGYKGRRSFSSGSTVINEKTVFISMHINSNRGSFPYHMIIREDSQRFYTAGNTDFIYVITNGNEKLVNKIFEYIDFNTLQRWD